MSLFVLQPEPHPSRRLACQAIGQAQDGHVVRISEPTRNLEQNAAMWPILEAFSRQLKWPVNGAMTQLSGEEWKDILTAAFKRETARVAMGLDGGVVMLGARTSVFSKAQFSQWIEFLNATAADRGVTVYEDA